MKASVQYSGISERTGRDLLYKTCKVSLPDFNAGLFADAICLAGRESWNGKTRGASGINGGSPLEISLRSDAWPAVNCTTCIGDPEDSALKKLKKSITAVSELSMTLCGHPLYKADIIPENWLTKIKPVAGTFGAYIGIALNSKEKRIKLYFDLFGGNSPAAALDSWHSLLSESGREDQNNSRDLLETSRPVMGCIEWSSSGCINHRLYWRLLNPDYRSFAETAAHLGTDEHIITKIRESFIKAAGGATISIPITGFVQGTEKNTPLGYYSSAPSRWGLSLRKQRDVSDIWQAYGGDVNALKKTWQLAAGRRKSSTIPILTILGVGVSKEKRLRVAAYFSTSERWK